jgi:DNA-binding transcriptional regulator YdaS (Cro superfamily)
MFVKTSRQGPSKRLTGSYSMPTTHSERALARAIELAGGQNKLAKAINYSQNAVWKAKDSGRISPEMAIAIEAATGGRVSREQLAPQFFKKLPRNITPIDTITDDEPVT